MLIEDEKITREKTAIRELFDQWAAAVRREDLAGILAHHGQDILMFDVPPPLLSRGLNAYADTWETFYRHQARPIVFTFDQIEITADNTVAFVTAIGHCLHIDREGKQNDLAFRFTMGLRKENGKWQIIHEHHSVPATD